MRVSRVLCSTAVMAFAAVGASRLLAQSTPLPLFPTTGVDYSGIQQFYVVAGLLAKGTEPSEAQWYALMNTFGYRLVVIDNEGIRERIELAFKPSLAHQRDSVLATRSYDAEVLAHLRRAVDQRALVDKTVAWLRASLADSIAAAKLRTARFLPPGTMSRFDTPFIGFAVFADDGYAEPAGILLDPLYVAESGVTDILSHEFHHSYSGMIDSVAGVMPLPAAVRARPDRPLYMAVMHLRNEGIADQIDKPYPYADAAPGMASYVRGYNAAYARTPAVLRSFDSLLVAYAADPRPATASRAPQLFWSNGHPNGAYIARTVYETFGIDSIYPAITNPFTLLRAYASALAKRGQPPPFSPAARAVLDSLEKVYVPRRGG